MDNIEGDPEALAAAIQASGVQELPVTTRHAAAVSKWSLHHNDPFCRSLLAQPFSEPLHLLTADCVLAEYGGAVEVI